MISYLTNFVCATEVLSPPHNISASVKEGNLLVSWSLPYSKVSSNTWCFEYQLDLGDQVQHVCVYDMDVDYFRCNIYH